MLKKKYLYFLKQEDLLFWDSLRIFFDVHVEIELNYEIYNFLYMVKYNYKIKSTTKEN